LKIFRLYGGVNTIGYLQNYFVCDKLMVSYRHVPLYPCVFLIEYEKEEILWVLCESAPKRDSCRREKFPPPKNAALPIPHGQVYSSVQDIGGISG